MKLNDVKVLVSYLVVNAVMLANGLDLDAGHDSDWHVKRDVDNVLCKTNYLVRCKGICLDPDERWLDRDSRSWLTVKMNAVDDRHYSTKVYLSFGHMLHSENEPFVVKFDNVANPCRFGFEESLDHRAGFLYEPGRFLECLERSKSFVVRVAFVSGMVHDFRFNVEGYREKCDVVLSALRKEMAGMKAGSLDRDKIEKHKPCQRCKGKKCFVTVKKICCIACSNSRSKRAACTFCNGTGWLERKVVTECPECEGTGRALDVPGGKEE